MFPDVDTVDLDRTVVTHKECTDINEVYYGNMKP